MAARSTAIFRHAVRTGQDHLIHDGGAMNRRWVVLYNGLLAVCLGLGFAAPGLGADEWRGLVIAPEYRCAPYKPGNGGSYVTRQHRGNTCRVKLPGAGAPDNRNESPQRCSISW